MRAFGGRPRDRRVADGAISAFGERLGSVLFRVPENIHRDDLKLASLLDAWPADLPVAVEFQH